MHEVRMKCIGQVTGAAVEWEDDGGITGVTIVAKARFAFDGTRLMPRQVTYAERVAYRPHCSLYLDGVERAQVPLPHEGDRLGPIVVPPARGKAVIWPPDGHRLNLDMVIDTVTVSMPEQRFDVVWRGHYRTRGPRGCRIAITVVHRKIRDEPTYSGIHALDAIPSSVAIPDARPSWLSIAALEAMQASDVA